MLKYFLLIASFLCATSTGASAQTNSDEFVAQVAQQAYMTTEDFKRNLVELEPVAKELMKNSEEFRSLVEQLGKQEIALCGKDDWCYENRAKIALVLGLGVGAGVASLSLIWYLISSFKFR